MKIVAAMTYTATPGLEQFPASERFQVWRSAHKQLLKQDAEYRQRSTQFRSKMVGVSVLFIVGPVLLNFTDPLWLYITLSILALLLFAGYTTMASFRHQAYLNAKVGHFLQNTPQSSVAG